MNTTITRSDKAVKPEFYLQDSLPKSDQTIYSIYSWAPLLNECLGEPKENPTMQEFQLKLTQVRDAIRELADAKGGKFCAWKYEFDEDIDQDEWMNLILSESDHIPELIIHLAFLRGKVGRLLFITPTDFELPEEF